MSNKQVRITLKKGERNVVEVGSLWKENKTLTIRKINRDEFFSDTDEEEISETVKLEHKVNSKKTLTIKRSRNFEVTNDFNDSLITEDTKKIKFEDAQDPLCGVKNCDPRVIPKFLQEADKTKSPCRSASLIPSGGIIGQDMCSCSISTENEQNKKKIQYTCSNVSSTPASSKVPTMRNTSQR